MNITRHIVVYFYEIQVQRNENGTILLSITSKVRQATPPGLCSVPVPGARVSANFNMAPPNTAAPCVHS